MGRQIRFFATATDFFMLLECVVNNGWVIINDCGDNVSLDKAKQMVQDHYDYKGKYIVFFATKEELKIVKRLRSDHTFLDTLYSDVIEIRACSPPAPNIRGLIILPNQYEHGRIWYERQYYDDNGNVTIKNNEVDKMYNLLVRKIRAEANISKDKFAYILPDAYRLYKEECYIPCSGKYKIIFD